MDCDHKHVALVTGFGPFDGHQINASWEAVKELEKLCANSKELCNVKLITKQIPVSYEHVSISVPELWREHDPIVVLHVGVSSKAECLTIEHQAHSTGYVRPDVHKKKPEETDIAPRVLRTNLDVKKICGAVNENSERTACKACISYDAGRYLCEYIFYHSLSVKSSRTLFVHVPDFNKYTSLQTAQGLHDILCCAIGCLKND